MNRFQLGARKYLLLLYRWFALIILYGVLVAICFYLALIGFYLGSSSWGAPVLLSRSDTASLDMLGSVVTSQAQLGTLTVDCDKLERSLAEMKQHRAALGRIDVHIDGAIAREARAAQQNGAALGALDTRKVQDNHANERVGVKEVREQIAKDVSAGLITKADADVARLALTEASNSFTDSAITEVLLRDQIKDHAADATKTLETLSKRAELKSEIAQLDVSIESGQKQLDAERGQIKLLNEALAAAQENPTYSVLFANPKTFIFVPYGTPVSVGAPLYRCAAGLFWCSRVGTVTRMFPI